MGGLYRMLALLQGATALQATIPPDFETPAFKDVLVTALESCETHGLVMDFTLGASQGQGVPIEPHTPRLAVQLTYGKTNVKGGETFKGALPDPVLDWNEVPGYMQAQDKFGPSTLVGVSAAAIKTGENFFFFFSFPDATNLRSSFGPIFEPNPS